MYRNIVLITTLANVCHRGILCFQTAATRILISAGDRTTRRAVVINWLPRPGRQRLPTAYTEMRSGVPSHPQQNNELCSAPVREQEKFYVSLWAQWWTRVCRQRPRLGYSSPAGEERSQCAVVVTRVSKTACPHISSIYDITCPAGATLLWTHAWYVTIRNLAGAERRAVTTRGAGAFTSAQSTTTLGHSTCFLNDW